MGTRQAGSPVRSRRTERTTDRAPDGAANRPATISVPAAAITGGTRESALPAGTRPG
jgi:hypothetical protein